MPINFGRFEKTGLGFFQIIGGFFEILNDIIRDINGGFNVFWKVVHFGQCKLHKFDE